MTTQAAEAHGTSGSTTRAELPAAYAVHQSAGRLRIRIPERKRDAAFFSAIGERLAVLHGVAQLRANPVTGSVLITHSLEPEAISRFAEENELFVLKDFGPAAQGDPAVNPRESLTAIGRLFTRYDRGLRRATGDHLDLSSLAVVALGIAGLAQLVRGNASAPAWYTAFWYALNILLKAQPNGNASTAGEPGE